MTSEITSRIYDINQWHNVLSALGPVFLSIRDRFQWYGRLSISEDNCLLECYTLVPIYQTPPHHIPEGRNLHSHDVRTSNLT
jgi:hypothetical protein